MGISKVCSWGNIPSEAKQLVVDTVEQGWELSTDWGSLQRQIASRFIERFGADNFRTDVHLSDLGVRGSEAEIDIVASSDLADHELGGFLVQIGGGSAYPRHEKELVEFMAVSRVNRRFGIGIMVVALDNRMKLEGRSSWNYCSGALLRLGEPVLRYSNLQGLLLIGLPTPKNRSRARQWR